MLRIYTSGFYAPKSTPRPVSLPSFLGTMSLWGPFESSNITSHSWPLVLFLVASKLCQTQRIIALETASELPLSNHPICDPQRRGSPNRHDGRARQPGSHCHVLPTCLHASSAHLFKCGEKSGSVSTRSTGRPLWPSGALPWKPWCFWEVKLIAPYDKWTAAWQCLGTVHRIRYTFFQMHT